MTNLLERLKKLKNVPYDYEITPNNKNTIERPKKCLKKAF